MSRSGSGVESLISTRSGSGSGKSGSGSWSGSGKSGVEPNPGRFTVTPVLTVTLFHSREFFVSLHGKQKIFGPHH